MRSKSLNRNDPLDAVRGTLCIWLMMIRVYRYRYVLTKSGDLFSITQRYFQLFLQVVSLLHPLFVQSLLDVE